jgi:predicted nucleotidyltransferase component of viral defense system
MKVDAATIRRAAEDSTFSPQVTEKVVRLGAFLNEVGRHPLLQRVLLLKGGTALNLGFGVPRRLSVDLDFNYIGAVGREDMLAERPRVESAVERIATSQRYRIQRSQDEHAGRKLYLGYQNVAGVNDRIEVDLNFMHRIPLSQPERAEIWQPAGFATLTVQRVGSAELCAGKLCALLDRTAARDLWDAARLPELVGDLLVSEEFRPVFMALAGTLPHPLHSYEKDRLERVTDDDVTSQLYPVLREADRPSAQALRNECWEVVEPLVRLTDTEREFVDALQVGEIRSELVYPRDPESAGRIDQHPGLRWKAQNAKRR